jgi:hypothetical protein
MVLRQWLRWIKASIIVWVIHVTIVVHLRIGLILRLLMLVVLAPPVPIWHILLPCRQMTTVHHTGWEYLKSTALSDMAFARVRLEVH